MNVSVSNVPCKMQFDHDITDKFEKTLSVGRDGYYLICSTQYSTTKKCAINAVLLK